MGVLDVERDRSVRGFSCAGLSGILLCISAYCSLSSALSSSLSSPTPQPPQASPP